MSTFAECVLLLLVLVFLHVAANEDGKYQQVHRYLWLLSGAAGFFLLVLRCGLAWPALWELLLYGVIQYALFARFYGKADCHCFCVTAIVFAAYGGGMVAFLTHMLLTICILAFVQLCKRNVNRKGNLHRPVAMIPYIFTAFLPILGFLALRGLL